MVYNSIIRNGVAYLCKGSKVLKAFDKPSQADGYAKYLNKKSKNGEVELNSYLVKFKAFDKTSLKLSWATSKKEAIQELEDNKLIKVLFCEPVELSEEGVSYDYF